MKTYHEELFTIISSDDDGQIQMLLSMVMLSMMLSIKLNERFTSMVSEAPMPTTSLNMFPRAAAAMVDKLNATPGRIMAQVQV
jgi:hypothetical protein